MNCYDAIVVGAGPAGCAAAYDLAQAGKHVVLLDRAEFPRAKACAGGLTLKAVNSLRYSIRPVIRNIARRVRLGSLSQSWAVLESPDPLCVLTLRSEFDAFCLKQTIDVGAEFRIVKLLQSISKTASKVRVATDEGVLEGRFLLGADGANSHVRRLCGFAPPRSRGFAIETRIEKLTGQTGMRLDFDVIKNGYGWVFSKDDHVNVGLCRYSGGPPFGRIHLEQYASASVGSTSIGNIIGQYVGCDVEEASPVSGPILLAGDAAGLADPLTGEGIYHAIVSGQAAARTILGCLADSATSDRYADELQRLRTDLTFCRNLAQLFYAHLDFAKSALSLLHVQRALIRTYTSGKQFNTLMSTVLRPLIAAQKLI